MISYTRVYWTTVVDICVRIDVLEFIVEGNEFRVYLSITVYLTIHPSIYLYVCMYVYMCLRLPKTRKDGSDVSEYQRWSWK